LNHIADVLLELLYEAFFLRRQLLQARLISVRGHRAGEGQAWNSGSRWLQSPQASKAMDYYVRTHFI
jgi:hypothetical protein